MVCIIIYFEVHQLNQSEMNTNKETFRLADYKNIPMKTNTEGKQNQEQQLSDN